MAREEGLSPTRSCTAHSPASSKVFFLRIRAPRRKAGMPDSPAQDALCGTCALMPALASTYCHASSAQDIRYGSTSAAGPRAKAVRRVDYHMSYVFLFGSCGTAWLVSLAIVVCQTKGGSSGARAGVTEALAMCSQGEGCCCRESVTLVGHSVVPGKADRRAPHPCEAGDRGNASSGELSRSAERAATCFHAINKLFENANVQCRCRVGLRVELCS